MPALAGANGGYYRQPTVAKPAAPVKSPLALAAAGSPSAANPLGFQAASSSTAGYRPPAAAPVTSSAPGSAAPAVRAATSPVVGPLSPAAVPPPSPSAATLPQYDLSTDHALQGVQALTGESDQQAQADALAQQKNILLGYGSSDLANATLGDANTAAAAGGNPTSTLAQLAQQRGQNQHTLTEGLSANNLLYSGYRVTQEQQAEQNYQNAWAKAASDVNTGLGTVRSNLSSALASNQNQRVQALNDAANRAIQAAIANGSGGTTGNLAQGGNIIIGGKDTGIPDTPGNAAAAAAGAGTDGGTTQTTGGGATPAAPNFPIFGPTEAQAGFTPTPAANTGTGALARAVVGGASALPFFGPTEAQAGFNPTNPYGTAAQRRKQAL